MPFGPLWFLAVYLAVVHRLMVSGSDRHASEWRRCFQVTGADGLTLDHAYKAMTWLGEDIGQGRVMTDAIRRTTGRTSTRWCSASCSMATIGQSPRS